LKANLLKVYHRLLGIVNHAADQDQGHEIAFRQFHGQVIAAGNYLRITQAVAILPEQNCVICHQAWSVAECTSLSPTGCRAAA
jgi:hypothetical protein